MSIYSAEFCIMRTVVEEVHTVRYMLQYIGVRDNHTSLIYGDNQGVIQMIHSLIVS